MMEVACAIAGALTVAAAWLWKEAKRGGAEIEQVAAHIVAEYD